MNIETTAVEQSAAATVDLAEVSLAEYRNSRASAAAAEAQPTSEEEAPAGGADEHTLGESEADEGAAEETTEQAESGEAAEANKAKKKGGWQRKIEAKDKEIEDLKRKLAEPPAVAAKQEGSKPEAPKAPEFQKPRPKLEDFHSIDEHADALVDWKLEKRDFEAAQKAAADRVQNERKAIVDRWRAKEAEAKEAHADYAAVLDGVKDIKVSPDIQRVFLDSEHGPEILYKLASTDRTELTRIAGLSPLAAAREIGKLEASFTQAAEPPKQATQVSKAPRPIRPVTGASAVSTAPANLADMPLGDYRARRESGRLR